MQYDVFISYARKDYADEQTKEVIPDNIVSRIRQLFDDNDITYWFDETGIYSGDQFVGVLADAIEQSSIFLYISTEASNASKWTINEIATAKHLDKKIIPFRYDGAKYNNTVLMYLAPLDYIDYQGNKEKAFSQLLASVKAYKQGVEKTKREREMLAKRKKAKEELMFLAKEYRKRVAELNSVEAKKLVAALRAVGVVSRSCPVCKTEVDVTNTYCPTCGWTISPIDDIEGAEYLSLVDKHQLEVASGVYGRCLAAERHLAQIDSQTSNSLESQALVTDLTERIVKLESQVSEKTNELQNAISERDKVELSSRETIMELQMTEVSLREELATQRAQMNELQVLLEKKEQMEKDTQKECERLKRKLSQTEAGKVLTSNKCEKVDLGLSVCWADRNVGASSPEDYGDYFAWGETEPKKEYTKENYKHYDAITQTYHEIGKNISGGKYDVAHLKWGGDWRMPTKKEIDELVQKCRWQWTEVDGVCGRLITGPSGNSIFLPAAGYREGNSSYAKNQKGRYWSGTGNPTLSGEAERICFGSSSYMFATWNNHCYLGGVIRPVVPKRDSIEELPNKLLVERALDKDVDACVELARRYYYGLHGYERNIGAANNYLKKVGLPLYESSSEEASASSLSEGDD